ncbi:MAG TPA: MBG domain-containing protein [Puia sp.]|nr:MBG domain-containing protein [Puia sp.]
MPTRAICTAILTGLSSMLFAQPDFVFSPSTIPHGQYGAVYTRQTLKVTGGKAPYKFSVSKGSLPAGVTLSDDGVLSGTPVAAGTYTFTVTAKGKSGSGIGPGQGGGPAGGPGAPQSGTQDYTLVVDPATLAITANNASIDYGDPMPTFTVSYTGFVRGDNPSSLNTKPSASTTATSTSDPGTYPITVSGAADPNYTFTYNPGTLTIHGVEIRVSAAAATKQYGTADPPLTYTVAGLPAGVSLTGSLSRAPGEDVGTYPITIGTLTAGGGFKIRFSGSNLTITKASQQISWSQSLSVGCASSTQVQLNASASSGLPVIYAVSDPRIATVSGNVLTLLQPGTAIVTAGQPGNGNYTAAAAVSDTAVYQSTSLISAHWNDVIFFDNSSGDYVAWQWYKNDSLIAGATSPFYSATPLDGRYYVVATEKDGQHIQTCSLTITPGIPIPGGISVYPNPATKGSSVTVVANYSASALQGATLQVSDMKGRGFQLIKNVTPSMQVPVPAASGIYVIDLLLAGGQKTSVNVLVRN